MIFSLKTTTSNKNIQESNIQIAQFLVNLQLTARINFFTI
jgi:hypothetical protein